MIDAEQNAQRIAHLEREHSEVLRRVEMLAEEISHAIAAMRLQAAQLTSGSEAQRALSDGWPAQLTSGSEAQRALSDGWQAARNHNEVLTQRLARCEAERVKLEKENHSLRRAAVLDPSGEGGAS